MLLPHQASYLPIVDTTNQVSAGTLPNQRSMNLNRKRARKYRLFSLFWSGLGDIPAVVGSG